MGPKGVIGAGFLITASIFFVIAGTQLADITAIAWSGAQATGTITGHERTGTRGGRTTIYSFKDASGRRFEGRVSARFTGTGPNARARRDAEIGRSVTVIYDPADPTRSAMNTVWGRWSNLFVMLFVLPHMLIGIYLIRADRKDETWEPG